MTADGGAQRALRAMAARLRVAELATFDIEPVERNGRNQFLAGNPGRQEHRDDLSLKK